MTISLGIRANGTSGGMSFTISNITAYSITLKLFFSALAGPVQVVVYSGIGTSGTQLGSVNVNYTSPATSLSLTGVTSPSNAHADITVVVSKAPGSGVYENPVDLFSLDSLGYNYTTYGLEYGLFTQCNSLSDKYEFGYNGQMKMNEIAGIGNHYQYKFREEDPRIGRFWSTDPLRKQYPFIAPYTFAEDRVIDGLDLEGLEYVTYRIYVDLHQGTVTAITMTTDYDLKSKNTKGAGVQYDYIDNATGKVFMTDFVKNFYGIYQGPFNPRLPRVGGDYTLKYDDYSARPIDEADASAERHDVDYDRKHISGLDGVLSDQSTQANEEYIKRADNIISKYSKREKDGVTGKPVTKGAARAAKKGKNFFRRVENWKKDREKRAIYQMHMPPQ